MITVAEHVQLPDGVVRLTLRVAGPLPAPWVEVLPATGGALAVDVDDALVSWTWAPAMVPADTLAVCGRIVSGQIQAWAARWAPATPGGPSGLILTEPGAVVL